MRKVRFAVAYAFMDVLFWSYSRRVVFSGEETRDGSFTIGKGLSTLFQNWRFLSPP